MGVRDEALGPCWSPCLWTAVMVPDRQLLLVVVVLVVVVVLMGLLVVVTCTGGISILLVWQDWLCGPEVEGPRPRAAS